MNDKARDLQRVFERLTAELPREANPATEQRVRAAFRARRQRSRPVWIYGATAAACLALAFAWFWGHLSIRPSHPNPTAADTYASVTAGFIPLPYAQSDVPLEQVVVVRVHLQASDWETLGVPIAPTRPRNTMSADLLVGQDGVIRAVRLLNTP